MRKTDFSKIARLSVIFVLIAAMALCMLSCTAKTDDQTEAPAVSVSDTLETTADVTGGKTDGETEAPTAPDSETITITVTVTDDKGEAKDFEIKTDADNLGDALVANGLVEGDVGDYGLYIKVVDGLRADYDLDGAYWAISKDGEYLMTGADSTPIADGEHYELTYTK